MTHEDILTFWFDDLKPAQWFKSSPELDRLVCDRFGALHAAARLSELDHWRGGPRGRLAEVIVLDQFSRHIHRGSALAFQSDSLALALAQTAVALGQDQALEPRLRAFLYMPYMHSESRQIHQDAVRLFAAPGLEDNLASELRHKAVIDRFGRFPHRNAALGRTSTPEEIAFLQSPGSRF